MTNASIFQALDDFLQTSSRPYRASANFRFLCDALSMQWRKDPLATSGVLLQAAEINISLAIKLFSACGPDVWKIPGLGPQQLLMHGRQHEETQEQCNAFHKLIMEGLEHAPLPLSEDEAILLSNSENFDLDPRVSDMCELSIRLGAMFISFGGEEGCKQTAKQQAQERLRKYLAKGGSFRLATSSECSLPMMDLDTVRACGADLTQTVIHTPSLEPYPLWWSLLLANMDHETGPCLLDYVEGQGADISKGRARIRKWQIEQVLQSCSNPKLCAEQIESMIQPLIEKSETQDDSGKPLLFHALEGRRDLWTWMASKDVKWQQRSANGSGAWDVFFHKPPSTISPSAAAALLDRLGPPQMTDGTPLFSHLQPGSTQSYTELMQHTPMDFLHHWTGDATHQNALSLDILKPIEAGDTRFLIRQLLRVQKRHLAPHLRGALDLVDAMDGQDVSGLPPGLHAQWQLQAREALLENDDPKRALALLDQLNLQHGTSMAGQGRNRNRL